MSSKIFVVTHKQAKMPGIEGYNSILVGAKKNRSDYQFDYYDDIGDNISEKNKSYCELTGMYWVWKNIDVSIVGLCHYRRYFIRRGFALNERNLPTMSYIESLFENIDVVLPKPRILSKNVLLSVNYAPNINDMVEIRQAIEELYPDYMDDYKSYLGQNKTFLYNMFIMKKILFNRYCEWIYSILDYIEKNHDIDKETDDYRKRLFGFLSERLIYVWVVHNVPMKKVYEMRVINSEEKSVDGIRHEIRNMMNGLIYTVRRPFLKYEYKAKLDYIFKNE